MIDFKSFLFSWIMLLCTIKPLSRIVFKAIQVD